MPLDYEELDYQETPLGSLTLRRRRMRSLDGLEVYEIILGTGYLMSSLFTTVEIALADLALDRLPRDSGDLSVVVGGLGLGYTAQAALADDRVADLIVVEALPEVISWHEQELVPLGAELRGDPRCHFVQGDFFALAASGGFDPSQPGRRFHAILLDIDHTPTNVLHQTNVRFYTEEGLKELAQHLKPDGVFALWADGEPESSFSERLEKVFGWAEGHTIGFDNPITEDTSKGAVYIAKNCR